MSIDERAFAESLAELVKLGVEAERERCAKIVDDLWTEIGAGMGWGAWTQQEYDLVGKTLKRALDGIRHPVGGSRK